MRFRLKYNLFFQARFSKRVGTTTFKKHKIFLNFENMITTTYFHLEFREICFLGLKITEIIKTILECGNYYKNQIAKKIVTKQERFLGDVICGNYHF
ncbi:hypothetical protein LEP1GSC059_0271 [Leptospira noguchii serovar Panama str. CZ214]|uniref:Uncharacterized protein n=1 Tax=Leptospira noguchii serovar Panama str. CZ214 TaxID=1001595 RepID=T0FT84_9LEPT|nr:hypothetical protein LEP1GSC059_0271 [Leptospira noguchii serovar Panama str. CZ214]